MELKDKILKVLSQELKADYGRLDDVHGITGFVVSKQFVNKSALERQRKIDEILENSSLVPKERRRAQMIVAYTPIEYQTVGTLVRVFRVKELPSGTIQILVEGSIDEAGYVRGILARFKGVRTTEPKPIPDSLGVVTFRAKGTEASQLTKEKVLRVLKKDTYVEVTPDAGKCAV